MLSRITGGLGYVLPRICRQNKGREVGMTVVELSPVVIESRPGDTTGRLIRIKVSTIKV